ncbi:MAG: maleylpyruvate isomerase family mycothiol-dependent enzyme [Acidimicrobiales bacterium]
MTEIDPDAQRAHLDEQLAALGRTDAGALAVPVPHIEGWTVGTVIGHTGWVLRYVTACLDADTDRPPSRSAVGEPPPGGDVLDWYRDAADGLAAAFDTADLTVPRPTFTGPRPARWWLRRLGHETAMHRWDVEASSGEPAPITARAAVDGIDEVFEVFAPARLQFDSLAGTGETIHLHATDVDDGEWTLTLHPDELVYEHSHAKGDVAARGSASDLLLLLWSRITPDRLEVFGDSSLLERWQRAAMF